LKDEEVKRANDEVSKIIAKNKENRAHKTQNTQNNSSLKQHSMGNENDDSFNKSSVLDRSVSQHSSTREQQKTEEGEVGEAFQEDDAWKLWTEFECESILENNCMDNKARFRLSQIWIESEENMDDAVKLLDSIQKSDPEFMCADVLMLLGDRLFSNTHKEYEGSLEYYKRASIMLPNNE
jgi:hypothetical protein